RRLRRAGGPSLARPPARGLVRPSWLTAGLSCERFLNLVLNYLVLILTPNNTPQSFAQTHPRASQARLHGRHRKAEHFACFPGGEILYVAQHEHSASASVQTFDGLAQGPPQLRAGVALLGVVAPVQALSPRHVPVVGLNQFVERDLPAWTPLAELHQGLIQGDAEQPGIEARSTPKASQDRISLDQSLLPHILGVLVVVGDVHRQPVNVLVVRADKTGESVGVPRPGGVHQYELVR